MTLTLSKTACDTAYSFPDRMPIYVYVLANASCQIDLFHHPPIKCVLAKSSTSIGQKPQIAKDIITIRNPTIKYILGVCLNLIKYKIVKRILLF